LLNNNSFEQDKSQSIE